MDKVISILRSLCSILFHVMYWIIKIMFWVTVAVFALIFGVAKANKNHRSH